MNRDNRKKVERIIFFTLLAAATALALTVARFFILPIILAVLSAALFYPIHRRIARLFSKPGLASAVSLLAFFLIILIPAAGLSYLAYDNLLHIANLARQNAGEIRQWLGDFDSRFKSLPLIRELQIAGEIDLSRIATMLEQTGNSLIESAAEFAGNITRSLLLFFVYVYFLFFFIRDGRAMFKTATSAIPLADEDREAVSGKFISVTRATLKSMLIIGGIQGVLGGLLFLFLGIEGAVLWGIAFLILATIPGLGAVLIWLPAAVILLLTGNYLKAAIMAVVGGGVIPAIDYLLRPRLVGQDVRLHPLLAFTGIIGGILAFGVWGIVLGPLVMAITSTLWFLFVRKNLHGKSAANHGNERHAL